MFIVDVNFRQASSCADPFQGRRNLPLDEKATE